MLADKSCYNCNLLSEGCTECIGENPICTKCRSDDYILHNYKCYPKIQGCDVSMAE